MAYQNRDSVPQTGEQDDDPALYGRLLELEELESLLEDIEEGVVDEHAEQANTMPASLRAQLDERGLDSVDALRARIAELHTSIDSDVQQS